MKAIIKAIPGKAGLFAENEKGTWKIPEAQAAHHTVGMEINITVELGTDQCKILPAGKNWPIGPTLPRDHAIEGAIEAELWNYHDGAVRITIHTIDQTFDGYVIGHLGEDAHTIATEYLHTLYPHTKITEKK